MIDVQLFYTKVGRSWFKLIDKKHPTSKSPRNQESDLITNPTESFFTGTTDIITIGKNVILGGLNVFLQLRSLGSRIPRNIRVGYAETNGVQEILESLIGHT